MGFESGGATGWAGTDWIEDILVRQAGSEFYAD
jgi:alpha-glucoside transport system substrate-binding protein